MAITRSARKGPSSRPVLGRPYHVVRDRKGRRTILCAVGDCVQVFSELPAFNVHLATVHEFYKKRMLLNARSSDSNIDEHVCQTYRMWKKHQKPNILIRLRSNLKDTLMHQYDLTEEEAIVQGGLNEEIVDTSDEDN
ncbi:hypothetical protein R1sor_007443 [Riccia sorocarpa]|uniref:C2H2-type domain-containing protein n=1 Tax=Riccia sorocarpa TaxID=122646 RepID=A0ABD3HTY5_9MARC